MYHQGIIFKRYKENNKFTSAATDFKISKTTINFKIGIMKLIDFSSLFEEQYLGNQGCL